MRTIATLCALFAIAALLAPSASEAQRPQRPGPRAVEPSGWFSLMSDGGTCLDVHSEDVGRDGARVHMWTCHGGQNQLWRMEYGRLVSASGGCLDVHGDDVGRDGARVHMWGCHEGANQQWEMHRGGTVTSSVGGCLDMEGGAIQADGTRAIMWSCHGGANQRFHVVPAARAPRWPGQRSAAPSAMDAPSFESLLARVRGTGFASERVDVIGDAAAFAWFTAAQIARLIAELPFSSDRMRAIELLAPKLLDRQNGGVILAQLAFSSDREQARGILAQYAP